ncbi:stage II sporulation protein P [Polycladomyces abyssicola]|uniref:Stage II sporulation protein P n=1 Tax=Polycladomyces abyssicola TaxID=1125966 RepID=A0A8D5UGQ1_9BACL|nr:stage II sporulation protein P [Polycladomyces abyssicola]BCU81863.1 stage II sporulation protein P [Polycladomyces abyssicola]
MQNWLSQNDFKYRVKLTVYIIISLALMFFYFGVFTELRTENVSHSDLSKLTSLLSKDSLLHTFGEIPYFFTVVRVPKDEAWEALVSELVTGVNLKDPRTFLRGELPEFDLFDTDIVAAGKGVDYTDIPMDLPPPANMQSHPNKGVPPHKEDNDVNSPTKSEEESPKNKIVYIYNTHYMESFLPELHRTNPDQAYDVQISVRSVSRKLKEELEKMGIGTQFSNKLYTGVYYPRLYQASRKTVLTAMKQNGNLQYFIDIHRDSRRRKKTTIRLNGKDYARICFIIGALNPHWQENKKLALQLHDELEKLYPGVSKGVFVKNHEEGNGEYNQSISPRSILIEIGGVDNTMEEEYRSTKAFAQAFAAVYLEGKALPVNAQPDDTQP